MCTAGVNACIAAHEGGPTSFQTTPATSPLQFKDDPGGLQLKHEHKGLLSMVRGCRRRFHTLSC